MEVEMVTIEATIRFAEDPDRIVLVSVEIDGEEVIPVPTPLPLLGFTLVKEFPGEMLQLYERGTMQRYWKWDGVIYPCLVSPTDQELKKVMTEDNGTLRVTNAYVNGVEQELTRIDASNSQLKNFDIVEIYPASFYKLKDLGGKFHWWWNGNLFSTK
jgi:hypothetical protein